MDTASNLFGTLSRMEDTIQRESENIYLQVLFVDGSIGLFRREATGRNSPNTQIIVLTSASSDILPLPQHSHTLCTQSVHVIDIPRDVSMMRYIATKTPLPVEDLGWCSADGTRHIPGA